MDYALGIKTSSSFLSSSITLNELFSYAKEYNYKQLFINDTNLNNLYKLLNKADSYKINSIVGLEFVINFNDKLIKMVAYARDDKDLYNLIRLASLKEFKDVLTIEDMKRIVNLVIVVPTNQDFFINNYLDLNIIISFFNEIKKDFKNVYIGLSLQSDFLKNTLSNIVLSLADNLKLSLLPFIETNYIKKEDREVYLSLLEINRYKDEINDYNYLLKKDELKNLYKNHLYIFNNLENLFKDVSYSYHLKKYALPIFPATIKETSKKILYKVSVNGLSKKIDIQNPQYNLYEKRLLHELDVIDKMGFNDYFLIVGDLINYAKRNDILVGPGRGSAAGSLVSYVNNITDVDPIKYNLLFERFLNIERKTMPDIDIDFPDDKRDFVISYLKNKYGKNHVVTISTFSNFAFKSSIRDVAKVLEIDEYRLSGIIKAYEKGILDQTDQEAQKLIYLASKLEGLPRQSGTHAAGVILAKDDLTKIIPMQKSPHDMFQSQFEASDLEQMGFLKIDLLGLRNLSIIYNIVKDERVNLKEIPYNDKKTYDLLSKGNTAGIFQLESSGMKDVLTKLKPNKFEDLVAVLALYRPGPMDFIDEYINRRKSLSYDIIDDSIIDILDPTYGIIVYQEQIMEIAKTFAGFNLSEADILRRSISSKDKNLLMSLKTEFINKAISFGRKKEVAEKIFDYIEKFANYGFNRSHSVAYAMISYQMAYLKANYFKSFIANLMTNSYNNIHAILNYKNELSLQQIPLYPPNINLSTSEFIKFKDGILMPLSLIKGISKRKLEDILREREKGIFKDYDEFKDRCKEFLNEENIKSLIHSNALNVFKLNHNTMLNNLELSSLEYRKILDDFKIKEFDDLPFNELRNKELEVLGFNILYNDLIVLNRLNEKYNLIGIEFKGFNISGIVSLVKYKVIKTKNNDEMAFLTLSNGKTELDFTLFPERYELYKTLLKESFILINASKGKKGYIINNIKKVEE